VGAVFLNHGARRSVGLGAAVICHFLFYLIPGILGMRTGLR